MAHIQLKFDLDTGDIVEVKDKEIQNKRKLGGLKTYERTRNRKTKTKLNKISKES